MRHIFLNLCILLFTVCCRAQVPKIDSLNKLLISEKADSNKVTLLWNLSLQYMSFKPDTSLELAQQALLLARRIKFIEGESRSVSLLANSQFLLGNYPKALNNYMLKLKIEEKRNSPLDYSRALMNIGLMYILLGEYPNALSYLYRADSTVETADKNVKDEMKYAIMVNIGEAFYRMDMPDSAGLYFRNSLTIAKQTNDPFSLSASMLGVANVLALQQNYTEALQYYRQSFNYLNDGLNNDMLCETTLGLAKVYDNLNNKDSARYFGRMSFMVAKRDGFLSREMDAANFLSQYFKKREVFDSAYFYIELTANLKDSINGQEKTKEAMMISTNEKLRQAEIADQKQREKATRFQQLQLLVIAVFIPLFFLLTLFISRIKIPVIIIKFMGIISLLVFFEYLTLLLHPFVANLTNHIPVLELLIFVCLAAGIIPLHHRLEHLLVAKLTGHKHFSIGDKFKPKTVKMKIKK